MKQRLSVSSNPFLVLPLIGLILLSGLTGMSDAQAQSRTEEAKDRLDGRSDDPPVIRAARIFLHIGIDVMPTFFYFQPLYEDEPPLRYNRYPYQNPHYRGIRTFDEEQQGRRGLWDVQATFSLPQTSWAMKQTSVKIKRNIGYWSLIGGYEYLKEAEAPYAIHQSEFLFERKFRFVSQGDGGLQFGLRTLHLDGDIYAGPDIGVNLEIYPWRPFSLGYQGSWTYTTFADVINQQLELGLHLDASRVFFRYRRLDIGGVKFGTFTAGAGFYF